MPCVPYATSKTNSWRLRPAGCRWRNACDKQAREAGITAKEVGAALQERAASDRRTEEKLKDALSEAEASQQSADNNNNNEAAATGAHGRARGKKRRASSGSNAARLPTRPRRLRMLPLSARPP